MGHWPRLELPQTDATRQMFWHHVIFVVDLQEVVDDRLVVWHISVVQLRDVSHDLLDLLDALGGAYPQLALRTFEALRLDILDLHDCIISLLSPFKFLIQEI